MRNRRALFYLLALWVVILLWPALRKPARLQVAGSGILSVCVWPRGAQTRLLIPKARWKVLSQQNKQNIFLAVQRAETNFVNEEEQDDYYYYSPPPPVYGGSQPLNNEYQLRQRAMRKSYDGLLKRFPRDSLEAFLLAQRLG
jgi:hypothetical protein